ncbi:substrate-binding protein [Rhodoligotrophos defluvii]|uniref:substrate-binding protein n=1 Tax=Rhodoligotrophos defluvii TaxID=2561934 RepID=UPI0010C9D857|nr:substrate-binding protein [Rhodoligotrophos defluvii]
MQGRRFTRRTALKGLGVAGLTTAVTGFPAILRAQDTVTIGFLSALTGLETILGETQLNCFQLAVEELNAKGGIAGREIKYIVEDDQTTTRGAIDKARKLVFQDKVDAIIGLIASLEHVAARSVTTPAKKLLIYTTYYEGEVCERYFAATGQVPNQQIDPTTDWLTQNIGKSVYILGSDYIWPRRSAEAIRTAFERNGGKVLGTDFFPFGTQDFGPAFDKVRGAKPDIVWMMVAGADGVTALKQYRDFGLEPQLVGNGWDEIYSFAHPELAKGAISNQAYFMGIDSDRNRAFIKAYQDRFGAGKPINAIGEAAYDAVHLYALAVEKAGTTDVEKVIPALSQVEFEAPQGHVNMSAANNHMLCNSILARANAEGMWETIQNFGQIEPIIPGCKLN